MNGRGSDYLEYAINNTLQGRQIAANARMRYIVYIAEQALKDRKKNVYLKEILDAAKDAIEEIAIDEQQI